MKREKLRKRNVDMFLYKTGYDGGQSHTLFDCAVKFDLSPNQVWLNNKNLQNKIMQRIDETGDLPTVAQEFGIGVSALERMQADANRGTN